MDTPTPTTSTETVVKEETVTTTTTTKPTIRRNASWGAILSITIILAMVVIGAFYAWGQRIDEERAIQAETQSGS